MSSQPKSVERAFSGDPFVGDGHVSLGSLFSGDSDIAGRTPADDWSEADFGHPQSRPENLPSGVSLCLSYRFPVLIWRDPILSPIYDDTYIPLFRTRKNLRHLENRRKDCWSEIWDDLAPMLKSGRTTTRAATWSGDFFFARELPREEVYETYTFALGVSRARPWVQGAFCRCTETADKVVGARRLENLRKHGVQALANRTIDDACKNATKTLQENPYCILFATIYLIERLETAAVLKSVIGFCEIHPFRTAVGGVCGRGGAHWSRLVTRSNALTAARAA